MAMWRRIRTRILVVGSVVAAALIPATVAGAQTTGTADLSTTMVWIGSGVPKAKVGQLATFAITATNLGPDTARGMVIRTNEADQLNFVSLTCSIPAACLQPGTGQSGGVDLAPGATVTATLVEQVCCFPKGESRNASVETDAASETPDPNPDSNSVTVVVRIVGRHAFSG